MEAEGGGGNRPGDKDSSEEEIQKMSISPDREVVQDPDGGEPASLNPERDAPPAPPGPKDYFYEGIPLGTMRWSGPIFAPELYSAPGIQGCSSWSEFGPPYHNPIERIALDPQEASNPIHTAQRFTEHYAYEKQREKDEESSPEPSKDAQEIADRALSDALWRRSAKNYAEKTALANGYSCQDAHVFSECAVAEMIRCRDKLAEEIYRKDLEKLAEQQAFVEEYMRERDLAFAEGALVGIVSRQEARDFADDARDGNAQKKLQDLINSQVLSYDDPHDEYESGDEIAFTDDSDANSDSGTDDSDVDSDSDTDDDEPSVSPSKKPRVESPRLRALLEGTHQKQPPALNPIDTDEDESSASQPKKSKFESSDLLLLSGIKPTEPPAPNPPSSMPPALMPPAPNPPAPSFRDTFLGSLLADALTKQDLPDFMKAFKDKPKNEESNPRSTFPPTRAKERLDRIRKRTQKKRPSKKQSKRGTLGERKDWFLEDEILKGIISGLVGRLRREDDLQLHQIPDPRIEELRQQHLRQQQQAALLPAEDPQLQEPLLPLEQHPRLQPLEQDPQLQQHSVPPSGHDPRLHPLEQEPQLPQAADPPLQPPVEQDPPLQPPVEQDPQSPQAADPPLQPPVEQDPQLQQAPDFQ